jgi:hypothetical protein
MSARLRVIELVRAVIVQSVGQEAVMAKRERFVTSVTCLVCALNGSATWEENESGNLETTIKAWFQEATRQNDRVAQQRISFHDLITCGPLT